MVKQLSTFDSPKVAKARLPHPFSDADYAAQLTLFLMICLKTKLNK